ncbi:MAG TPA: serine/threonine protein kinase [Planctomycetes bacterium]|nr:serine/threonine protein kinase [Fuerstiella sp.]HIK93912.1 serine/threonine protein kinase [Planctomycetota bacterium]
MVDLNSQDDLKSFLIASQLLRADQWQEVEAELVNGEDVSAILQLMEGRHILTPLQTRRILKGDTEGLVLGNYKLLYRNASGGFARVYRAETVDGQETVAVKLLRGRWASDPAAVASFQREARICQRFKHPNIVPIYDVGSEGNFHYFTMEFVEGGNLRDFLRIRETLSPKECLRCVYEICSALEYALEKGATHRDLKLTNVLMSSRGVAKLVDFGLAGAELSAQAGTSDDVHRALEYASLERGTNAPNNDPRSDIFFVGSIMYELLCGTPAWPRTGDREERKLLSRYTSTAPIGNINPNLPASVVNIVQRMMKVSPSDRYQSTGEAMEDLKNAMVELGEWCETDEPDAISQQLMSRPFELLVVDSRKKRKAALNTYFTKHGFAMSFVAEPTMALERLKSSSPPDGLLILADRFTESALDCFPQIQAYGRSMKTPCLAVFPQEDRERVDERIHGTRYGATAYQPATLREIRVHFEQFSIS